MLGSPKAAAACDSATNIAAREKYWKELSIEEKIERLRSLFKQLSHQQDCTARIAHRATSLAENHQHSDSGDVLVSVRQNGDQAEAGGRRIHTKPDDPDAVYI